jgi:cystathionine beta-lyase
MRYDFDRVIDRSGNHAAKYDERRKKFGTEDVIPLWIADMDFRTAQPIIDALAARAQEGIWGYTARPDSYFDAIRAWQKRRNGWDVDPALMSFSLGVVQTISACVKLFTPEGGSVLIQTPVYSEFYDMAEAWNRSVLENRLVERDGKWSVDWADFEDKLQRADLFLLCNPHNPLGIVWTPEELRRMVELCMEHHVPVVSDEIHSDLIFHGKRHTVAATVSPAAANYVITAISGTKTFNLAGLQASTAVFPNRHTKQVFDRYWRRMDIHRNNAFSLTAMEAAFTGGEEWLEQLLPYISANFDFVVDYCKAHIPQIKTYAPDATYLMWLDCRELELTNQELHDFMIQKAGLGLNDGCSFGRSLQGYMRLNAACPRSVLEQAMGQLRAAVDELLLQRQAN